MSDGQFQSGNVANPTGKGGFGDNPHNRNSGGRPKNKESISFWIREFINMSILEFDSWKERVDPQSISMAAELAYVHVGKARISLKEFKEITDRVEGKANIGIDKTEIIRVAEPGVIDKNNDLNKNSRTLYVSKIKPRFQQ